jgi:hypothetical protein
MRATPVRSGTEKGEASFVASKVLKTRPAIVLEIIWFYMLAWGGFFAAAAFGPDAGDLEFEGWMLTAALLVPIILIPVYLSHCVNCKRIPQFRHWFPWVLRIAYVSVILAICDSWAAGTERRAPLLSKGTWAMSDGGTRGSIGFGYSLTYYRRLSGEQGPEVWFWFSPFTVRWTSEHVGVRWLWKS